ncbi:DUF4158 domain-containing protein, partial [Nocardia sp.]|uniref:LGFP repeat-containing protein n=1 Tax=Nocardia sp. TaxID=1821 RepID=UPI00258E46C7
MTTSPGTECGPGPKNKSEEWTPTENPKATVEPGRMRSDCQEIPDGFTKADADKAETMEASLASRPQSRVAAGCQVYWPAPYEVCGAIRDKYNALGGPNSFLLFPTSNELSNPDGVGKRTTFQNGPIYWSPAGGAHPVVNHFFAAWQRQGWEGGVLGYPTTDEIPSANGGRRQEFQGAAIYWHLNEAYAIGGAIRDKWNTVGAEGGPLGYPNTDELSVTKNNGRYNNFENGTITWSGQTGSRLLYGAIRDRWASFGREDGEMGLPLGDELVAADGTGHYANFEDGSAIYWYPVIGAWRVTPGILRIFAQFGAESGKFGYPTSAAGPAGADNGIGQGFENGSIIYIDRGATRREHMQRIREEYGYRSFTAREYRQLAKALLPRAMEKDQVIPLIHWAIDWLRERKIILPALTTVERLVWETRRRAEEKIYRLLNAALTPDQKQQLDKLIGSRMESEKTPLGWIKEDPGQSSPRACKKAIDQR